MADRGSASLDELSLCESQCGGENLSQNRFAAGRISRSGGVAVDGWRSRQPQGSERAAAVERSPRPWPGRTCSHAALECRADARAALLWREIPKGVPKCNKIETTGLILGDSSPVFLLPPGGSSTPGRRLV